MTSADVRKRREKKPEVETNHTEIQARSNATIKRGDIPKYVIDLSLPPVKRYQRVAADFEPEIATLPALFDNVVENLATKVSTPMIHRIARLLLRRVHNKEQNAELLGIQEITGIKMYLLVAFNVLLDLFMGCTSGGVRTKSVTRETKMLHFRTLDWGMDPLRKVVVQLDFIEKPGGPIIATSITYVGFVGVLTGVKKGLSMSLNFRPNHDASSRLANFRFYFHHILVLLGARASISSLLRNYLIPPLERSSVTRPGCPMLAPIEREIPGVATTAAYLIFSDGARTIAIEKDHRTAVVHSSTDFVVITNHDEAEELAPQAWTESQSHAHAALQMAGMQGLIEDSKCRKDCAMRLWKKSAKDFRGSKSVSQHQVTRWIERYPITNEETHYAVVMDATEGSIVWSKRHLEPAH